MHWILPAEDPTLAAALARALDLHPVAARVLVARGFTSPDAAAPLFRGRLADLPDPSLLRGMDAAISRLAAAVQGGEPILLYGDYDVDGVTATALLLTVLRELGARVDYYLPKRLEEGYGLHGEAVERAAAAGFRLLLALDCGIVSLSEAERARALGLDLIVIDHHQPGAALPQAVAVIDPHRPDCPFPEKGLCAAGLAFFVAIALRRALRRAGRFAACPEPDLRRLLDLVALGTVADVVPLTGVNRILAAHGLRELAGGRRPGVRALKYVSGFAAAAPLSAGQVAFRLAPRINAAGRLGDARAGVELLTTADESRALDLARGLDAANAERQAIEQRILDEALSLAQPLAAAGARSLVLARQGWHPGVVGIVASRLVERFHRPTFVVALDGARGRGSGRSVAGFHLLEALRDCREHLLRFGGHRHAAGVTVETAALDAFRTALEAHARRRLSDTDLAPRLRIDARVLPDELDPALAEDLQRLGPFGAGNPEPVLAAAHLTGQPRVLPARRGGPGHLRLVLAGPRRLEAIGFGLEAQAPLAAAPFDAAFQFGFDDYRGLRRLSLRLKALRPAA